jgi:hypothetical protein
MSNLDKNLYGRKEAPETQKKRFFLRFLRIFAAI